MCSRFLRRVVPAVLLLCTQAHARVIRVCADPNNLPFSNQAGEGLENKLAELIAAKLGAKLEYVWWSQRKSFVKNSLTAGRCDMIMGVPTGLDSVLTTNPYYRSTYVFLSRKDRDLRVSSLADPRFGTWKIGVHVVGDDYAPPAHSLAKRGLSANLVGFSLFGQFGEPNPAAKIIDAVANGSVDIAIVWGPHAGYFASRGAVPMDVTPVSPPMWMGIPFTFDIALAVREEDRTFRDELDRVLDQECGAIQSLLSAFAIPRTPEDKRPCAASQRPVYFSSL
jgi:mxaJ protein